MIRRGSTSAHVRVTEPADVAAVIPTAERVAQEAGLSEGAQARLSSVVSEVAANQLRHAARGELLIAPNRERVDLLALDRGPGIESVSRAMRDGFSTAGLRGCGLGVIERNADALHLHSTPGDGTVLHARVSEAPETGREVAHGWIRPMPSQDQSGDGWGLKITPEGFDLWVVDGLGHGPAAAASADQAIAAADDAAPGDLRGLLLGMNESLRGLRGAVASAASFQRASRTLSVCGVGNIQVATVNPTGECRRYAPQNGILGGRAPRLRIDRGSLTEGACVVMHSDGLSSIDPSRLTGLWMRPVGLISGVLLRDFGRAADDACVVVARPETEDGG